MYILFSFESLTLSESLSINNEEESRQSPGKGSRPFKKSAEYGSFCTEGVNPSLSNVRICAQYVFFTNIISCLNFSLFFIFKSLFFLCLVGLIPQNDPLFHNLLQKRSRLQKLIHFLGGRPKTFPLREGEGEGGLTLAKKFNILYKK